MYFLRILCESRRRERRATLSAMKNLETRFRRPSTSAAQEFCLQGGLNPKSGLDYYEDTFRFIKSNYNICLHALSPEEICFIADQSGLKTRKSSRRLVAAGLDSIPGGGAEILVDDRPGQNCPEEMYFRRVAWSDVRSS